MSRENSSQMGSKLHGGKKEVGQKE